MGTKSVKRATWRRTLWTADEEIYLRAHYSNSPTASIAKHLGRTVAKVYAKADRMGLRKSEEFKTTYGFQKGSTVGAAYRFPKGNVPCNAGLRRPGYSSGRMKEGWFRKGERSGRAADNWKPVGTIVPDSDGYLRIKVREAQHGKEPAGFGNTKVWPLLHRHVWEQHHGPIPKGHIVRLKDGDKGNCSIQNLELVSMADHMRRNSLWTTLPRELAEVIQLNGALKRKLRKGEAHE